MVEWRGAEEEEEEEEEAYMLIWHLCTSGEA